jgi:hypothetical protein
VEWVRASQAPASLLVPIPTSSQTVPGDAPKAPPVSESVAVPPVSESVAAVPVSESVAAAPQPAPTLNLLGLAVTNRFIFWAKIAAIIVYVPALIVEVIAASATQSGGNQPWYGNLAVAILLALALAGLLIDRRFFGSMGGIIKWNRMNGWQKGLVGFFYFLALLPLGVGIFYAVSLLPRRPEAFADGTAPNRGSTGLAPSLTGANLATPSIQGLSTRTREEDSVNWKIRGGTLALENGVVTIRRGSKFETIPVNTIVGTELSHVGAATKLGCLGCSTFFLITIPIAILVAILPHPWVLTIQTQGGVKVVVPVGRKGRAVAIQRAIIEAR